jgi:hypothetical protein
LLGLAACSLVASCGGGGSIFTSGLPGTGGTGLYALGSISGFGSVVVNGIRFDDTAASVEVDGGSALSTDLRLGMVATIDGTRGADVTLGTASRIQIWSLAQGTIMQVSPLSTGVQLVVAGMTIQVDAATVLDGIVSTASLAMGQRVAIWGLQSDASATRWRATRVALVGAGDTVTTGLLVKSDGQFQVNGLLLVGGDASGLASGQLVRVMGTSSGSGASLQVVTIRAQDVASQVPDQRAVELEGVVSALYTGSRFMLGGVMVDGSAQSGATAQLKVGDRIEVEGDFVGGVLMATTIGQEDAQSLSTVEMDARIEQFNSLADFVVRSQRCDASGVGSIQNGTAASLKVGVKVHLKGTKAGDVLMVTELKIDD